MRPPAENKTPVVSQEILQPLLAAALYVTTAIASHLVTLSPQVRQRQQEKAQLGEAAPDLGTVKDALRRHVRDGEPLEAVRDVDVRTRLQQGWSADDPLLSVSFTALAREAGTARIRPAVLADVRPLVEQAAAAVGTAKPWGRQAEDVPLAGGTGTAPCCRGSPPSTTRSPACAARPPRARAGNVRSLTPRLASKGTP